MQEGTTSLISTLTSYFTDVLVLTMVQMWLILLPLMLLIAILNRFGALLREVAVHSLGVNLFSGIFRWLGTSIHEFGHLVFCKLFGLRVRDITFYNHYYRFGSAGFVHFELKGDAPLHKRAGAFFVGIGPLLFGSLLLYYTASRLLDEDVLIFTQPIGSSIFEMFTTLGFWAPAAAILDSSLSFLKAFFDPAFLISWQGFLLTYLSFAIASSLQLSQRDIEVAGIGMSAMLLLVFLFNSATLWIDWQLQTQITGQFGWLPWLFQVFYLALLLSLASAIIVIPISILIFLLRRSRQKHPFE